MHFLVSALLVPYLPDAHARFGIAPVTLAGVVALLVGMLGWSLAAAPWQLFVTASLSGVGWAATSGAAIIAMVSPWFDRRRALALGHALNGASIGGILFAPLWVLVISAVGFAEAVAVIGIVTLAVLGPLVWRYLRPTPESLGLAPDGDRIQQEAHRVASPRRSPARFLSLMQSWPFATLSIAFAIGMFAQVGVTSHIVTRLAPLLGAQVRSRCDQPDDSMRRDRAHIAGRSARPRGQAHGCRRQFRHAGMRVTLLAVGSTITVLLPGCILFGLGVGGLLLLPPLIAQRDFAPSDVPRVVALVTAVNQAVFAFAPAILGVLRELSGGYALPFLIAAGLQVLASMIVVLGRRLAWPKKRPTRRPIRPDM